MKHCQTFSHSTFSRVSCASGKCVFGHMPSGKCFQVKSFQAGGFGRMGQNFSGLPGSKTYCSELTVQSRSSEQPSLVVGIVKVAAVNFEEGAGCHCIVPQCRALYMQQWIYSISFPNFNELSNCNPSVSRCRCHVCSDESCRRCRVPLQSTQVQGAAAEYQGAGCRCRVPRCREPCIQQRILQRVQGASVECCCACSGKSAILHSLTVDLEPWGSTLFASHVRRSCPLFAVP